MRTHLRPLRPELRRASLSGRLHRARLQGGEDVGFTIVETAITLLIVSIIMGLVFGFITNFFQQSVNVSDTMSGVQQDQTAGEGLLQYLHAAIVILPGSNATTLDASILDGVTSGTNPAASGDLPGGAHRARRTQAGRDVPDLDRRQWRVLPNPTGCAEPELPEHERL